jgi:serine-type D-Ala-D-Ala carboxypeptidase (penicillin-binding protein 5/6)
MTDFGVLQQGRLRRQAREAARRRARRRRRQRDTIGVVLIGLVALLVFMSARVSENAPAVSQTPAAHAPVHHKPSYATVPAPTSVRATFKAPVRSGLLFEVRSGRVLWQRRPTWRLPIASLTKMMTALVVVSHARTTDRVLITSDALHYSGSGVGLLPRNKRVSLKALLYGLMLPSGNDAAIALADHVAGTQTGFVRLMNEQARRMGLGCSHFTSVSGIVDQGNYSCARDLAAMAHAILTNHVLGTIVATRDAVLPFPIKGGKLFLYNNNPLLRLRYPGADGVKTGYTLAAGRCLVAAARRGRSWYGIVLLHSDDPPGQAQQLLNDSFAKRRRR